MLSSDESDVQDEVEKDTSCSLETVLRDWGMVDCAPDAIPLLFLPEPIVLLVSRRKWSKLLLCTHWHEYLIHPRFNKAFDNNPLFESIPDWPPYSCFAQRGKVNEPSAYVLDAEMNTEDSFFGPLLCPPTLSVRHNSLGASLPGPGLGSLAFVCDAVCPNLETWPIVVPTISLWMGPQ